MASEPKKALIKDRVISLDILRGLAVLIMIAAHGVYFFHDNSDPFLRVISRTGNLFAFSTFLFVSGAASYIAHLSKDDYTSDDTRKIVRRTMTILSGYYVVAFASVAQDLILQGPGAVTYILDILLFRRIPSFSEFLLPFVIFHLSLLFLRRFYRFVTQGVIVAGTVSLILFLVGSALYSAPVSAAFEPYLAVLAGREGFLRFPILQYFPVFAFGILWGRVISGTLTASEKLSRALAIGSVFWILGALSFFVPALRSIQFINPLNRWPPSIGFLAEGLAFIFLFETVFPILVRTIRLPRLWDFFGYIGMDSFDIYIVSTLILFLFRFVYVGTFSNPTVVLLLTMGLLSVTVILSSINVSVFTSGIPGTFISMGLHGRYRLKKRYFVTVIVMFIILAFEIHWGNLDVTTGGIIRQRDLPQTKLSLLPFADKGMPVWFHEDYPYMKRLVLRNTGTRDITAGTVLAVTFDHRSLVSGGKSKPDARDLTLVYRSDEGFEMLMMRIERPDLPNTTITFPVKETIRPGISDARYELYYGSDFPLPPLSAPQSPARNIMFEPSFGDEQSRGLIVKKNRTWFVKDTDSAQTLTITVRPEGNKTPDPPLIPVKNSGQRLRYTVASAGLSGFLSRSSDGTYTASIPVSGIPYGVYALRVTDSETGLISPAAGFTVTAPVYVAVTLDWEGYDVPDATLDRIGVLSDTHHKLPFTHFFSPRIYVSPEVNPQRAEAMTGFIKTRMQTYGDDLALHLHMQDDFVSAAGIPVRSGPHWGYLGGGYDVPATAYTENELIRLMTFSKSLFAKNGLPEPRGFRAGGWFADAQVLNALEKTGFTYDSSGRVSDGWSGKLKTVWNLKTESQPYVPSRANINSSVKPGFSILEIPNNGGTTFEKDGDALLKSLKTNFPEGFARDKKSVVFISHPQFADREFPRLNRLLTSLENMLAANDEGPVIYTTTGNIESLWTK